MGQRSSTETVVAIMQAFLEKRSLTQAELARHAGVSVATLRRRLHELTASGFPLEREDDPPHVWWSVPRDWFPGGVVFGPGDVTELLRRLGHTPKSPQRDRLIQRIIDAAPREAVVSARTSTVVVPTASESEQIYLPIIEDAAIRAITLEFKYFSVSRGAKEWRHASVQRVVIGPPARFLAVCHLDDTLRWFRVDNVLSALLNEREGFRRADPAQVEALLREAVDGFHESTDPAAHTFFVRAPESNWVAESLPSQAAIEAVPGGMRFTVTTGSVLRLARFVVGLGAAARSETPDLARVVAELAEASLRASATAGRTAHMAAPEAAGAMTSPAPADAAPRNFRWLHLSDIHLGSEDGYGHDIVLSALIEAFSDGGTLADRRPDVIFCTGDIAQSGKPAQYVTAGQFFTDLSRTTGVPTERIFLVPGNHDIDRDRVSKAFVLPLADRRAAESFFGPDGVEDREIAFRRFGAYAEFQRDRFGLPFTAERPYLLTRFRIGVEIVGVLGLNTAWIAHQADAQGKLVIGERLVRQALRELADEPSTIRVVLLHHPLDWLRDFERDAVRSLLVESVDFILHGHLHAQRPEAVIGPEGAAAVLAAGATYQGWQWLNSALLVEVGETETRVEAITFREHGKGIWMRDAILAPRDGGIFRMSRRTLVEPRISQSAPVPASFGVDTSTYLRRLENETRAAELPGVSIGREALAIRLEDVFIPLHAHITSPGAARGSSEAPAEHGIATREPLVEVLRRQSFLVVVGDPGSGKTTLLRHAAHRSARAIQGGSVVRRALGFPETGELALPLLIPLRHLAATLPDRGDRPLATDLDDAVIQWARQDHVEIPELSLRAALLQRRVLLLLDGLDEIPDATHRERVLRALGRSATHLAGIDGPGSIIVTSRPAAYGLKARLGEPFVEARVQDLERADVDRFLDRWIRAARGLSFEGELDARSDAAVKLRDLRDAIEGSPSLDTLSRTPVLLTAIVLVHHHGRRLPPQRALLYDKVVDVLLQRFEDHPLYKPPMVRAHLAAVAWDFMVTSTAERLCEEEHEENVTSLVARRLEGLPQDAGPETIPRSAVKEAGRLLDEQELRAGLLRIRDGQRYRFVHRTVQEYLAAWWLADQPEAQIHQGDRKSKWLPVVKRMRPRRPQWT
jgi:predicted DNA-binding transcriptional regulator YafY